MNKESQKLSQNLLNEILANCSVLLMQTLNYHWNIVGAEFHDYHLLFDKQYKELFEHMDDIAERVRATRGKALGSYKNILEYAQLKEDHNTNTKPKQMILNLLKQYEATIEHIRSAITTIEKKTDDFGSINFLEDLVTKLEKTAWMLRSLAGKE